MRRSARVPGLGVLWSGSSLAHAVGAESDFDVRKCGVCVVGCSFQGRFCCRVVFPARTRRVRRAGVGTVVHVYHHHELIAPGDTPAEDNVSKVLLHQRGRQDGGISAINRGILGKLRGHKRLNSLAQESEWPNASYIIAVLHVSIDCTAYEVAGMTLPSRP